jgi:hypothetical protein
VARKTTPIDRILDSQQERLDELAAPAMIASGMDREGMPPMAGIGGLAQLEDQARHRLSPRKNRWKDVAGFDQRVGELEARRSEIQARLQPLHDELSNATSADAQAVAAWITNGKRGDRPGSIEPALKKQVAELTREADGLVLAVGEELHRKAAYVEKHRVRLAKDARRHVDGAHARMVGLVAELERARDELAATRESELWALLYPHDAATRPPQMAMLAGGLKRPGERLGLVQATQIERLFEAMRADGEWLKRASTPEQRALLEGRDPKRKGPAWWGGTEQGRDAERRETQEIVNQYVSEYGHEPDALQLTKYRDGVR